MIEREMREGWFAEYAAGKTTWGAVLNLAAEACPGIKPPKVRSWFREWEQGKKKPVSPAQSGASRSEFDADPDPDPDEGQEIQAAKPKPKKALRAKRAPAQKPAGDSRPKKRAALKIDDIKSLANKLQYSRFMALKVGRIEGAEGIVTVAPDQVRPFLLELRASVHELLEIAHYVALGCQAVLDAFPVQQTAGGGLTWRGR